MSLSTGVSSLSTAVGAKIKEIITTLSGKQPLDADLTAIAALTGTTGLLKKTAADTWTLDTSAYVTSSGVTSVTGTAPIVSSGGATPAISHSTADGYLHIPATGTTNDGKFLKAGATAGSVSWVSASEVIGIADLNNVSITSPATNQGIIYNGTSWVNGNGVASSCTGNAATAYGLNVHTGRNNEANKVVRTDASGYATFGWINTTSGDTSTTATTNYFVETGSDGYIRKKTKANVITDLGISSKADTGQTMYIGTTAVTINRASAAITLAGTSISGNATTATTLQTARTINGVSFNGSANITIPAGATGAGSDKIFFENGQTVTTSYSITAGMNAMTTGNITINSGVTVTVPTGARWVIV